MAMSQNYRIEVLNWQSEWQSKLKAVREAVFIIEQHVPLYIEWDEYDDYAIHLLALDDHDNAIGCARILLDKAKIGRMGVVKSWRGCGLGFALLEKAIEVCKLHGLKKVSLSSQTHAIKFYEKAGFLVTSEAYIDANIWHVDMQLEV
jgi:predicted GNAT family N-acyltransferase